MIGLLISVTANLRLLNAVWNFYKQNIDIFEAVFLYKSDYE